MTTWGQDLAHLEKLKSQGKIKEYIAFKEEKGIMELWEYEENFKW